MDTSKVYHYVYRITNIIERKHYYGVRSCSTPPAEDLGITYFSSSTDKMFIKDQKENTNKYRYKVIIFCNSREKANALEIKLHKKVDAGNNPNFYNKANSTSNKFHYSLGGFNRYNARAVNVYKAEGRHNNVLVAENVVVREFCEQTKDTLQLTACRLNSTLYYYTTGKNINHKGYFCVPTEQSSKVSAMDRYVPVTIYNVFYIAKEFSIHLLGATENLKPFCKISGVGYKSLTDIQYHRARTSLCVKRIFVIDSNNLATDLPLKVSDLAKNVNNSAFLGNFVRHKNTEDVSYLNLLKSSLESTK